MYRSPFGILDNPFTAAKNENQRKRANPDDRECISFTEVAMQKYQEAIRGAPKVDTGTGRVRPKSAGAVNSSRLRRGLEQPSGNDEYNSLDMLTTSLSKTQLLPKSSDEPVIDQDINQQTIKADDPVKCLNSKKQNKKKKYSEKDLKNESNKKVINNVQLSQEEWEKIFAKYNLQGIDEVKFNFLKKGTGFTTKYDYVGKPLQTSDSSAKSNSATANSHCFQSNPADTVNRNSTVVQSEHEVDAMMQEFFPSSSSRKSNKIDQVNYHKIELDQHAHSLNRLQFEYAQSRDALLQQQSHNEHRFLREYSRKKKQEDQEFSQLLEKELTVEMQHLQRCIQECNEFCQYLGKDFSYQYRDYRSIRKIFVNLQLSADQQQHKPNSSSIRIITVDKFHEEHSSLLKEFKSFSKYHPKHSLDTAKPPDSAHFIGVDDLFQQAKKMEGESETKGSGNVPNDKQRQNGIKPEDDDPYHPNIVTYNELKRRNETIAMQLQIMQEYDDLQDLLRQQLNEIQKKGWNLHYKTLFLSNFTS
jgi:hypothetical protein